MPKTINQIFHVTYVNQKLTLDLIEMMNATSNSNTKYLTKVYLDASSSALRGIGCCNIGIGSKLTENTR